LGWLATYKIITIFVLAILILPITNVFAFFNGEAATVVVGQGTFTTGTAGTTATTINGPETSAFDSAGNLWVADVNNNRVLKYAAPITTGETATVVIGQGSFTTNTAGTTATTLLNPTGISFDSAGNLWVADQGNNRVLKYAAPITSGETATVVVGQGTFTTGTAGTTATTLQFPTGISFDSVGNLWVADQDNNRVLKYPATITTGESATVVVGQGTFTTGTSGTTATTLNGPDTISFDSAGNLWVADKFNNRALKYAAPITTGEAATVVVGQGSFTTKTAGTTATTLQFPTGISFDSVGNLWVADEFNNRVLKYPATLSQATGQVTVIAGSCGINIVSGSPINYGSLIAGSISTEQTVVLQNTGTVAGTLAVHGTDWLDGSSTSQILVGNTKFSTSSGTYASKTALTTVDQTVGTINPTPNLSTFWQLQINLISSSFTGPLTQTMTFSNSC